jgi:hypothetical protein
MLFSNTNSVAANPDIQFNGSALLAAEADFIINIDSDDGTPNAKFSIRKDSTTSAGAEIFSVNKDGLVSSSAGFVGNGSQLTNIIAGQITGFVTNPIEYGVLTTNAAGSTVFGTPIGGETLLTFDGYTLSQSLKTGNTLGNGYYLDGQNGGLLSLTNGTATSNQFVASISGIASTSMTSPEDAGLYIKGRPAQDNKNNPSIILRGEKTSGNAVSLFSDILRIQNYTTNYITVDSTGSMGIGTTAPASKLYVTTGGTLPSNIAGNVATFQQAGLSNYGASIAVIAGNASTATLYFGDPDQQNMGAIYYNNSGNYLAFRTNGSGTDSLIINSSGNVGIGATSPTAKLDIEGTFDSHLIIGKNTQGGNINFRRGSDGATAASLGFSSATEGNNFRFKGTSGGSMFTWDLNVLGNGSGEVMRLANNGYLGIGTTNPTAKLHVVGTGNITDNTTIGGTLGVTGATTLNSTLAVTGATTISSTLGVGLGITISSTDGNSPSSNAYLFGGLTDIRRSKIAFTAAPSSNDHGFIEHLTSTTTNNSSVIRLCPGDDASGDDYVSIGGSDELENIKLFTSGLGLFADSVSAATSFTSPNTSHTLITNSGGGYIEVKSNDETYNLLVRATGSSSWVNVGASKGYGSIGYNNADGPLFLADNDNVGIGTNAPGAKLEVGTTSTTSDSIIRVLSGDTKVAGFEAYGSNQGTGYLYVGQSSTYGGGIRYNGDDSPDVVGAIDHTTFFRRSASIDIPVFSYGATSDIVTFYGGSPVVAPYSSSASIRVSGGIGRTEHNVGHLEGSHTNIGDNSAKTNPIYTIGSNYTPTTTTLSNMYGIGYSHATNATIS